MKQERLHELVGHNKAVTSLSFSWDGRLLISTSEDGTLRTVRRGGAGPASPAAS